MSWFKLKTPRGVLKVKPRSQLRSAEKNGEVRVVNLGPLVISWWSDADVRKYS